MSEAGDLVDRQVDAYRDRDLERFLSFYAEDVKIRDFDGTVLMNGHAGMRGMYGQLFNNSPELAVKIPRQIEVGDYVISEEDISGFVLPGFPTEMQAAVIYRVHDGLIRDAVLLT